MSVVLPPSSHVVQSASPVRRASSPRNSRPSSIDLGPASVSVALTIASPLAQVYPRSSILLNSRKRVYKGLVYASQQPPGHVAPVVTHIPAVPSRKHKEKERQREREREREREHLKSKSKDDEKIWGIPKKALLLGLGDLNFQTTARTSSSSIPAQAQQSTDRKRPKTTSTSSSSSSSKRVIKATDDSDDDSRPSISSSTKSVKDGGPDDQDPMDPEELAALNAIINTRRSMAAAQALVSGQISIAPRSVRGSSFGSASQSRPTLDRQRFTSQESVPSVTSFTHSSISVDSSTNNSNGVPLPLDDKAGASSSVPESSLQSPGSEQNRIRFAPLPQPKAPLLIGGRSESGGAPSSLAGSDDDLSDSDLAESDYDTDDEDTKSMKGKWYLMGMPPAVFTSQYYTGKSSRRNKLGRTGSVTSFGGELDDQDYGGSMHRKSTSSLTEAFNTDAFRKFSASSDVDDDDRGRTSSGSRSKRSKSQPRRRSRSRNGAPSSGDEDERARRRQLIRLARPGGTGMVTLPDGTKIRARRVNDNIDPEEPEFIEWGFAGLAREASRRNMGGSNPASLATTPNDADHKSLSTFMNAEQDEEDDGSGMAWVRRRRRDREERARLERETAANAASPPALDSVESTVAAQQSSPEADDESAAAAMEAAPAKKADRRDSSQTVSPTSREQVAPSPLSTVSKSAPDSGEESSRRPTLVEEDHQPMFFADPESLPTSPSVETSERAPAMDASIISEASVGDKGTPMSGSQLLSKPYHGGASNAGDSTPRHTAPVGLSANQFESIRKRHEDEVMALGAEVLAQNRRNTQRRQASTSVMPFSAPTATSGDVTADQPVVAGKKTVATTSGTTTPSAAVSTSRDSTFEKNPLARAVGSIMRKATTESDRTVRSNNEDASKKKAEPPLALVAEPASSPPETVASSEVPSRVSPQARSQSPESMVSHKSSSLGEPISPATNKSASSLHVSNSGTPGLSPHSKRMAMKAGISTPAPSPWLPRRPDARGLAVVPLPQLGVRPERPREGRVWQFDVSDDSDAAAGGASDNEGSDLDAEELEEEELKTAMQKKRATTLAAGQEVVHASLESKATSRAANKMASSYDLEPVRQPSTASKRRSSVGGSRFSGPATPSAPKKAPPRLVRSGNPASSRRRHEADDEDDEDFEEKNLWPAASATSKTGTPRPRHILVNLPGGPGIWDSKTGGGRNAVAAINSVAAARAKAIKKRADQGTSFELPPGWTDEMMDYGWGRAMY